MARDPRTAKQGVDRNKYYKAEYGTNMKLSMNAEVCGVFYSTDYEPLRSSFVVDGSARHKQVTVKLETTDYIPDLEPSDFVLYGGDGELYVVDDVISEDINDNGKRIRRNPIKSIISLRR